VGVVIGVLAAGVELVNRDAAGFAEEQLGDLPSSTANTGVPRALMMSIASCGAPAARDWV
jgi:hypothetical protein